METVISKGNFSPVGYYRLGASAPRDRVRQYQLSKVKRKTVPASGAAAPAGRIMGSLVGQGGIVGPNGGLISQRGGLVA